jgi:ribonuclease HI
VGKLDRAAAARHNLEWTKGHAGHEVQEIADKMACKIVTLVMWTRRCLMMLWPILE